MGYDDFGIGLCKADVKWKELDSHTDMVFYSGFTCLSQDKSNKELNPQIAWIIAKKDAPVCDGGSESDSEITDYKSTSYPKKP